jgi:hypothetical protein
MRSGATFAPVGPLRDALIGALILTVAGIEDGRNIVQRKEQPD